MSQETVCQANRNTANSIELNKILDGRPFIDGEGGTEDAVELQKRCDLPIRFTVEPSLVAVFFSISFSHGVVTLLILSQTCEVHLGFSSEKCSILGQETPEALELEETVQKSALYFIMMQSLLQNLLPTIELFFLGPWSDVHGRRPVIVFCLAGLTLTYCFYAVVSSLSAPSPMLIVLSSFPLCILGGCVNLCSSIYCYVSESCSPEDTSFRLGLVEIIVSVSGITGSLLSSPVLSAASAYGLGYLVIFVICAVLCFGAFLHAVCLLPESVDFNLIAARSSNGILSHPVEMVRTCMKKRDGGRRSVILLCVTTLVLWIFAYFGPLPLELLFVRKRFSWTYSDFTIFSSTNICVSVIGIFIGTKILPKYLKAPDIAVAFLASFLTVVKFMLFAFATSGQSYLLYVAVGFNSLSGAYGPVIRAILSRSVPKEDLGRVFSFCNSIEALSTIVAPLIYSWVYNSSIEFLPGMPFLLSALVIIIIVALLCVVSVIWRIHGSSIDNSTVASD